VHEYSLGQLKAQLAEPTLVYAWQQGQTLSSENAVDFALAAGEEQELFFAQPQNELEIAPIGPLPFESTKPSGTPLISPPLLFNSDNYPVNLTQRELEVLRLLAEGLTNSQIADKLVLSPRTVRTHVRFILGKLGVNSRAATRFVLENDRA
jgi:DNA-binding CsgD family transcriptional regulator